MLNEIKVDEGKGRSRKENDQYKKSEGTRNSRIRNNSRKSDNVVRARPASTRFSLRAEPCAKCCVSPMGALTPQKVSLDRA